MSATLIRRSVAPQTGRGFGPAAIGALSPGTPWLPDFSLRRADWSLAFVAFLLYTIAIISQRLHVGTEAMSVALLTLVLERHRLRASPVVAWAAGLFAWAVIGWPTSDYAPIVADNLLEFAKVCAVVFVAVNVITTRDRLRIFLIVLLGTFALYPVRGTLIGYFLMNGGVGGRAAWNYIYNNPNDLAGFLLLEFSLVAGVVVTERKRWISLAARIGMVVLPFLILLTGSRGGFIGFIAFVLLAFRRKLAHFKAASTIAVVAGIIFLFMPDNIWHRLGTIRDADTASAVSQNGDESSIGQRRAIWAVASKIAIEHPVMGVGLGAYSNAHFQYSQQPGADPSTFGYRDAHSTYLRMAAELGLVGLALFLGLIGATLLDAERTRRRYAQLHPRLAMQLFYMEVGFVGYLVAAIWASWGSLVFTYVHLAIIHVASHLLKQEAAGASPQGGQVPPPRSRPFTRGPSRVEGIA